MNVQSHVLITVHAGFTTRSDIGPARQAPEMPAGIGVRELPLQFFYSASVQPSY